MALLGVWLSGAAVLLLASSIVRLMQGHGLGGTPIAVLAMLVVATVSLQSASTIGRGTSA